METPQEKICGIYKITSPSGRIYIGQANDVYFRWKYYRRLQCKTQSRLYNSFLKHGVENHIFEIIYQCKSEQLNYFEKHYVDLFQTFNTENGLNLRDGGGSKGNLCEETKRKLSEGRKGEKNHNFGKPHSEETKQKMSKVRRGRKQSPEHIRKRTEAYIGKKHSEESRRKMSEWQKGGKSPWFGRKHSEESKKKISETKKRNNILKIKTTI